MPLAKPYAIITFNSIEDSQKVKEEVHGIHFDGMERPIFIEFAQELWFNFFFF